MTPQGTVNHLRAEAEKLPAPTSEGLWIRRGPFVFRVVAGLDEHSQRALAWQVDAPLYFRPTLNSQTL